MTLVEVGLDAQLLLVLLGIVAAIVTPGHRRSLVSGTTSAVLGATGVLTGAAALDGTHGVVGLPTADYVVF